ncbi:MAG: hypothetical protein QNI91_15165 [Arenicellales bacterium]|nr:hypothetical protein [Arenicellales bacterium]
MIKKLGTLAWVAGFLISPLTFATPGHNIYLTASEQEGVPLAQPETQFSCNDKIYAVIELDGLSRDKHKLDAIWRDPRGKDREHTEYEFMVHGNTERIWVWLKLHRPMEAAIVAFMNPSAGMDEFIGKWELHLAIDSKLIDKRSFSVLC